MNHTDFELRNWRPEDLDSLVKYANNPRIAARLTDRFPYPYTREAGEAFIASATTGTPVTVLAIAMGGIAVGGIGLHPQSDVWCKNAELGYWLGEPYWGQSIVTYAIQHITFYGFDHLPIDRIFARPFGSNVASQRVLVKAGFTLEAKLSKTIFKNGHYEDEYIYGIRRSDTKKADRKPLPGRLFIT